MTPPLPSRWEGSSIDEILDDHAGGLQYFERFLPLLGRVPGAGGCPTYEQVCAKYDEQRGVNLGALGSDADAAEAMSVVLGDQLEEQIQLRRVLQMRWHGEAGEAVQHYLSSEQQSATDVLRAIEDSHQTISAAVDVIREAVTDKAEMFGILDVDGVDGKDMDQIDAIVAASGIECLPIDRESVFPRLASAFDDLRERALGADVSDEFAGEVTQRCRSWIDTEFVPRVTSTCDAVVDVCTSTDTAVRECLALVVDVLGSVNLSSADLDDRNWAITPTAAAAEPGLISDDISPAPQSSQALAVHQAPAAAGPTMFAPPNAGNIVGAGGVDSSDPLTAERASGVGVHESLEGLVDRVVTEIIGRVDQAFAGPVGDERGDENRSAENRSAENRSAENRSAENRSIRNDSGTGGVPDGPSTERNGLPPASGDDTGEGSENTPSPDGDHVLPAEQSVPAATDERGHLEAELDGHRARIALEHDGAVSLELDTPGLGARSFELRISPLGLPEIVEIPATATEVDDPQPTVAATPAVTEPDSDPRPEPRPEPEPQPEAAAESLPLPDPVLTSDAAPAADSNEKGTCSPEATEPEQPVEQGAEGERVVDQDSATQHPVSADLPILTPQPHQADTDTGAGLSEAGTL